MLLTFKGNNGIPGFRLSNFLHKSMQWELKSLASGGNFNSVALMMFWSSCRRKFIQNSVTSRNSAKTLRSNQKLM